MYSRILRASATAHYVRISYLLLMRAEGNGNIPLGLTYRVGANSYFQYVLLQIGNKVTLFSLKRLPGKSERRS